jgi:hypothetical protein
MSRINKKIIAISLIILFLGGVFFISSSTASNHDSKSSTYLSNGKTFNISATPSINGNVGHIVLTLTSTEPTTKTFLVNDRKISLSNNQTTELNTTDFEIPQNGVEKTLDVTEENGNKVADLTVKFENNGTVQSNSTLIQSNFATTNSFNAVPQSSGSWLPNNESIMMQWLAQVTDYTCGPHTIVKSVYDFVDTEYSEMSFATNYGYVIGTDGTSPSQLTGIYKNVANNKGFNVKFTWYYFSEIGWDGIRSAVADSNKNVIIHDLYKNTWGHYEFILNVNTNDNTIRLDNSLPATSQPNGGHVEDRSFDTMKSYMNGISGPSVLVVERI